MSFGDRFCVNGRVGQGEAGALEGCSRPVSGLRRRRPWLATGRTISAYADLEMSRLTLL